VTGSAVERYLGLGLRLGGHVEGIVDAYYGPPELAAAVDAEPPVDPRALVSAAEALLDELEDGWLRDQLVGLRTYAGMLAGESGSYPDEVEGCYGVRPAYTDEAVFMARTSGSRRLPVREPLAERYERWQNSTLVPTEQIERTVAAAIEEARAWTRGLVELPDGEGVAHAHAQSPVTEGIAVLAPEVLLEGEGGAALAAVIHGAGIEFDLAHALAVRRAGEPCRWAEVNAALMLHDAGASKAETHAYLKRWALMTSKLAAHMIRFFTEPTTRTYILTYSAGGELCRSYVAGEPERFRSLLTEQTRVRDLLEARDAAAQ
jgi:hypothetical protein